mmetsp:Transcript_39618/g.60630  ORF Transcript_39618/g.60630 Transcript_39618/m.60630 type:complete len:268 (+) Transcript_39618:8525-9328(+)
MEFNLGLLLCEFVSALRYLLLGLGRLSRLRRLFDLLAVFRSRRLIQSDFILSQLLELSFNLAEIFLKFLCLPAFLILFSKLRPELATRGSQREEERVRLGTLEVLHPLQDLFLIQVLVVKVLRDHFDGLVHGVAQLNDLDGASVVREHRTQVEGLRNGIDLIVNTLALHIEEELALVVFAAEGQLLLELLVAVGSEHHVNGLLLAGEQSAVLGEHLEAVSFLGSGSGGRDVRLVVVAPVARDFLLVLELNLGSLSRLHADLAEVKIL